MKLFSEEGKDGLLNELYTQMFIVAYSKVHNKSDALDIVQESWIKILSKIDSLKEKDKLIQWAKVIASNTAINLIKKKNTQKKLFLSSEELKCGGQSIESEIEDRVLHDTIYDSLAQLDNETRKMLLYKYHHGLLERQIAEIMGIPLGTVKARIHRGKEKLRSMLAKQYNLPPKNL